jgi:hypothetical protein
MRREKKVRNRVDLRGCLIEEKDKRNREERSFDYIKKYKNTLEIKNS